WTIGSLQPFHYFPWLKTRDRNAINLEKGPVESLVGVGHSDLDKCTITNLTRLSHDRDSDGRSISRHHSSKAMISLVN
ncbi:MAG: hypothetical protein WA214_23310, partial [Pseudolabrys sp.]